MLEMFPKARKLDLSKVKSPVSIEKKEDGWRLYCRPGEAWTRTQNQNRWDCEVFFWV